MQSLSSLSSCSITSSPAKFKAIQVKASWDIQQQQQQLQQKLPYNRNAPRTLTQSQSPSLTSSSSPTAPSTRKEHLISDLLKRTTPLPTISRKIEEQEHETYLGYERWLPTPPKVVKPRSVFNATNLAYIGDCIYELYARRHFLFPPLSMGEYSDRVMAVVRCEAQDALLQKLLDRNFFSDQERVVLRWGKNIVSGNSKTKRRAGAAVYNRASSLETLIGYLYLTNVNRLEKLMLELGFSVDSSMHLNLEELITGELNRGKD